MPVAKLSPLVLSIAAAGLWACSGGSGTGSTSTGGTTTGGTTTGGTSGGTGGNDAGFGLGAACTQGATPDPCTTNGFACTQGSAGTSTCQLPGEFSPCVSDGGPGCAVTTPPLFCEPGFTQASMPVSLCVNHCTHTADCPDALTSCQNASTQLCFYDFCGPGAPIANGTTYYAVCNNGGTNNGTCMPLLGPGNAGLCQAGGPVALWQQCSDTRPDGGTSDLCDVITTCVMFPVAGFPPASMCAPICAPTGSGVPGPSCGTGQTCISAGPMVSYGYCLIDCSGGQSCPAPTSCKGLAVGSQTFQECLP